MDALRNAFPVAVPTLHGDRMDVPRGLLSGGLPRSSQRRTERPFHLVADPSASPSLNSRQLDSNPTRQGRSALLGRQCSARLGLSLLRHTPGPWKNELICTPIASGVDCLSSIGFRPADD